MLIGHFWYPFSGKIMPESDGTYMANQFHGCLLLQVLALPTQYTEQREKCAKTTSLYRLTAHSAGLWVGELLVPYNPGYLKSCW